MNTKGDHEEEMNQKNERNTIGTVERITTKEMLSHLVSLDDCRILWRHLALI